MCPHVHIYSTHMHICAHACAHTHNYLLSHFLHSFKFVFVFRNSIYQIDYSIVATSNLECFPWRFKDIFSSEKVKKNSDPIFSSPFRLLFIHDWTETTYLINPSINFIPQITSILYLKSTGAKSISLN